MKKNFTIFSILALSFFQTNLVNANTESELNSVNEQITAVNTNINVSEQRAQELQLEIDKLSNEKQSLQNETNSLNLKSEELSIEIEKLSKDIASRNDLLENQARNAQVNSVGVSYINIILDSKSIIDVVNKAFAMNTLLEANNKMLNQQKSDKASLETKQKENQEAINKVYSNLEKISLDEQTLLAKKAELKLLQIKLKLEKSTLEEEKYLLKQEKLQAEEEARIKSAELASFITQQTTLQEQQNISVSQIEYNTSIAQQSLPSEVNNSPQPTVTYEDTTPIQQQAPIYSSSTPWAAKNARFSPASYPTGECTWGVKSQLSWVGPYWGNAKQWIHSAAAEGFTVGTTPTVGSIAVWTGGYYGHVAVVISVESNQNIQVLESNYAGNRFIGNFRGWFNPTTTSEGAVYYIYPPR